MQDIDRYFWDRTSGASKAFRLRRLFEYASFPDLLKIPFEEVKDELATMDVQSLRTGEKRKEFLTRLKGCISISHAWTDALARMTRLGDMEETESLRGHLAGTEVRVHRVREAGLVRAGDVDRS
ncbi:MAG: hypothetical protein AB1512_05915 [Thermodesulfobacteriota bacterium]